MSARTAAGAGARDGARLGIDALVLVAALALVLYPLLDVYGGSTAVPAIVGGLLIGAGIALAGAWRGWSALTVVAGTVVAFVLAGGALAVPSTAIAGVVPTGSTVVALARGAISSWSQVVTLQPPVGEAGEALVAVYLLALVGSVAAVSASGRLRGVAAATGALVPVGVLVAVVLLGERYPSIPPVATGTALAVVLLPWAAWRTGTLRARRVVASATLVAAALAGGVFGAPLVVGDQVRYVVRDEITPPFDPRDYASPLSAYRSYLKELDETTLFTVTGLPAGARVRLATLDRYDGVVWNVAGDGSAEASGEFRRVGGQIPTDEQGEVAHVQVTIDGLTGVWLPTVGQATAFDTDTDTADDLRLNDATGAAVVTGGVHPGLTYAIDAVVPPVPSDEEIGTADRSDVTLPPTVGVPDVVATTAADVARNAGQPVEVARSISQWLTENGFYSDGGEDSDALSGHGADRMASLLGDSVMVGNGEQYASAMALMVREMGWPARVVLGFVPQGEPDSDGVLAVTGDDVEAWVEVGFTGYGWVPFDATPPREQTPDQSEEEQPREPEPQVVQPPPPPPGAVTPPDDDTEQPAPDQAPDAQDDGIDWAGVAWVALLVGVPLLLLALPFVVIAAIKARRRRRRRRRGDTVTRVAGGWAEVVDVAHDLRRPVPPRATRSEAARALADSFAPPAGRPVGRRSAEVSTQVGVLAREADRAVFAPGAPEPGQVDAYWSRVESTVSAMRRSAGWRRRARSRLSTASLRRTRRGAGRRP
ncbi:transglutaminase family protein [Cellulomonas composti]|uniref:Transglutaminase n=1 Tax=Cellulomonas composti TaxID=266130 RepID=A0A511J9S8_9CELL|nr:transglutaminase domain-containing protein [Cellulomonas composti]GEL94732.1 transglutaminase [Cellulomonas composti]